MQQKVGKQNVNENKFFALCILSMRGVKIDSGLFLIMLAQLNKINQNEN